MKRDRADILLAFIAAHPGVTAAEIPMHLRRSLRDLEARRAVVYKDGAWHVLPDSVEPICRRCELPGSRCGCDPGTFE